MAILKNKSLQEILDEYRKSTIQSEAEVRSKFIVPLICALGYPSELRAEEFPVYGYDGGKPLSARPADFILFTDSSFADYRKKDQKCKRWVENHSLLVIEAKKPGELKDTKKEDVIGQARFYREWSKSVAYIVTDGVSLYGFLHNSIIEDYLAISCDIYELPQYEKLWDFSYEKIQVLKNNQIEQLSQQLLQDDVQIITSDEDLGLPSETISYMRTALGKNGIGLTNVEVTARFLNTTSFILRNDLRYNIPEYMLEFPRHYYQAQLYIDNCIVPCFDGEVIEYYRDEIDRYEFRNTNIDIDLVLINGSPLQIGMSIHVMDSLVEKRISDLRIVKNILEAKTFYLRNISDETRHTIRIPINESFYRWQSNRKFYKICDEWLDSLEKLKAIEEYYSIKFELEPIEGEESVRDFYHAVDFVYSGTTMQQNSYISCPRTRTLKIGNMVLDAPVFLETIPKDKREHLIIHGITFETDRSYVVPKKIKKKGGDLIIPICCECIVIA